MRGGGDGDLTPQANEGGIPSFFPATYTWIKHPLITLRPTPPPLKNQASPQKSLKVSNPPNIYYNSVS